MDGYRKKSLSKVIHNDVKRKTKDGMEIILFIDVIE